METVPTQGQIEAQQKWIEENPNAPIYHREVLDEGANGELEVKREATLSPEDIVAAEEAAVEYRFDDFEGGPQLIAGARGELGKFTKERKTSLNKEFSDAGYTGKTFDEIKQRQFNAEFQAELNSRIEAAVPYPPNATEQDKKAIEQRRDSLKSLLEMPDDQFEEVMKKWGDYQSIKGVEKMNRQHNEALQDTEFNSLRTDERLKVTIGEKRALDNKYGNTLDEVGKMPLIRDGEGLLIKGVEPGDGSEYLVKDRLKSVWQEYMQRQEASAGKLYLQEANVQKARLELEKYLKAQYRKAKLSPADIQAKLDSNRQTLERWIKSFSAESDPFDDLEKYSRLGNAEKMWSRRHEAVRSYIGPMAILRTVRASFRQERPANDGEKRPKINLKELLKPTIDHSGSRKRKAGEAMRRGGSISLENVADFRGGVRAQLELARNLGRHEDGLMKAAIYICPLWPGGAGENFAAGWDALSSKEKKEKRKKLMLGMLAASKKASQDAKTVAKKKAGDVSSIWKRGNA